MLRDCGISTKGRLQMLTVPVLKQMGKVASHQKWVNHVVPAKALHDGLDWVGLKVLGSRTGQIKGQQGEA